MQIRFNITCMIFSMLLFGMISSSQAAEITSLSAYANTDYGGKADLSASLTADEDIYYISCSVKQTYPSTEADDDYEHVYSNMYVPGITSVSVNLPQLFDGHIKIAAYTVKVEVYFWDFQADKDTATTTVDVYKPVYEGYYKETGVLGYSELTAHYFNGSAIVMDGFAWAYNGTENQATITGRFRHTVVNKALDDIEEGFSTTLRNGESSSHTTNDWGPTHFNFDTTLELGDVWECDAYLRIKAGIGRGKPDEWYVNERNTFDHRDRR